MTWNPQPTGNKDDYYDYGTNDAVNETLQQREDRAFQQQLYEQQLENQSIQEDQEAGRDVDPVRASSAEANTQGLAEENVRRNPEIAQNQQQEQQAQQEERDNTYQQGDVRKEKTNNVAQEIGTAVVGAGIDFVEDIGEVTQRTLQGGWFDNDFEVTWLQADDNTEPMNQTMWGNVLRGILNFGLGFAGTGGIGHLGKASRIPGLVRAGRFLTGARTTLRGQALQGAVRGGMATFLQENSQEGTIYDSVREVAPWAPHIEVISTDEDDSPLERRVKSVLEDMAMGGAVDILVGYFRGAKAARRASSVKTKPTVDTPKVEAPSKTPTVSQPTAAPDVDAPRATTDAATEVAKDIDYVEQLNIPVEPRTAYLDYNDDIARTQLGQYYEPFKSVLSEEEFSKVSTILKIRDPEKVLDLDRVGHLGDKEMVRVVKKIKTGKNLTKRDIEGLKKYLSKLSDTGSNLIKNYSDLINITGVQDLQRDDLVDAVRSFAQKSVNKYADDVVAGGPGEGLTESAIKNIDTNYRNIKDKDVNDIVRSLLGSRTLPMKWHYDYLGLEYGVELTDEQIKRVLSDLKVPTTDVSPVLQAQEAAVKQTQKSRKDAVIENVKRSLEDDPNISQADPHIHSDYFDMPDKGVKVVEPDSTYQALKDQLRMANEGSQAAGRRANLLTDAAMKRITKNGTEEANKYIKQIANELDGAYERIAGTNVAGQKFTLDQLRQLGLAKYADIVATFPEFQKQGFDWDKVTEMLMEDSIIATSTGQKFMAPQQAIALELLMSDIAGSIADLSAGINSVVDQVPVKEGLKKLYDNVEAGLIMNQEASEFTGSLLRSRNWTKADTTKAVQASVDKRAQIRQFRDTLEKLTINDPDAAQLLTRAFAETGGDVSTIQSLYKYSREKLLKVKGPLDIQGDMVESIFTTMYNSILSGPKTIFRAFTGTMMLNVLRPMQISLGGLITGDKQSMMKGAHMFMTGFESISEAWSLSKNAHDALLRKQAGPYVKQAMTAADSANWKAMGKIIREGDSVAAKFQYNLTDALINFNNNSWVNYPTRFMTTIDVFSKTIVGRQDLKALAFDKAFAETGGKNMDEMIRKYETEMRDMIFNRQGEVADIMSQRTGKELSLQLPLTGRIADFDKFIQKVPLLRPFFLFMRTGVNALEVVQKHTPGLAKWNSEVNSILKATPEDLTNVLQYGIDTPQKLMQQQALVKGRIATGYLSVGAATGLYLTGNLSGNGPHDRELRNAWIKQGWQPRSIKVGGKWLNYDGIEPFASFLALVADIGDNQNQLGETGTENFLRKASFLIGMNVTNKSFLSGLNDLNGMLSQAGNKPASFVGNLINNIIPYSSVRNEIANVFNPGLREVEQDLIQTIMNRNPGLRGMLPVQYDPLDGSVVRDFDFPSRMFNAISPISIKGEDSDTRRLLRESNFDINTEVSYADSGYPLSPEQKSRLSQLIGEQNIEAELARVLERPDIKAEIEMYRQARSSGIPGQDKDSPQLLRWEDSKTFRELSRVFSRARRRAMPTLYSEFPELRTSVRDRQIRQRVQQTGDVERVRDLILPTR